MQEAIESYFKQVLNAAHSASDKAYDKGDYFEVGEQKRMFAECHAVYTSLCHTPTAEALI